MNLASATRRGLFVLLLGSCVWLAVSVAGRYAWQVDLSAQRINSLSDTAGRALAALPGTLHIDAFIPRQRVQRGEIERLLAPYLAGPADLRLRFVDPVADPATARAAGVRRHGELHLQLGERREVLAQPDRRALDAALGRLALGGSRWVVALRGHGENAIDDSPDGLARLVAHVERLGYRLVALDPRELQRLPDNTAVLLLGAPDRPYDPATAALIQAFVAGGGGLLWLVDHPAPGLGDTVPGIALLPGTVVDAAAARYGLEGPANAVVSDYAGMPGAPPGGFSTLPHASAFELRQPVDDRWRVVARLRSSPQSWNETGPLRGRINRDPALGEQPGPLTVGTLLQADDALGGARVAIIGSRHPFGNDSIGLGANRELAGALLHWLSGNPGLAADAAGPDLSLHWSTTLGTLVAVVTMLGLPLAYLAGGLWLRRHRRRA